MARLSAPAVPLAPEPDAGAAPPRTGTLAAFSAPYIPSVWVSGCLGNMARGMAQFLCIYLVNKLTGSPLLVQCAGASFFAPMFLGGIVAGAIADRSDRRTTVVRQLALLVPLAALMGVAVTTGAIEAWMVYPFLLVVGIGGVVDMTNRRAMVYDLAGDALATNALALETLSMTGGVMTGALVGGAIIDLWGVGSSRVDLQACKLEYSIVSPK